MVDRHWFGSCVAVENIVSARIEINWVFVSGHRNRLHIRVDIKIRLISMIGSKLLDRRVESFVIRTTLGWVIGRSFTPVAQ